MILYIIISPFQKAVKAVVVFIGNSVLGNLGQSLKEDVLGNKAVLAGEAVKAVVLDALRNAQRIVHAALATSGAYFACNRFNNVHYPITEFVLLYHFFGKNQ
jgi:hypothetical protein